MQKTININKKPMTAKQIINAKAGTTNGGDYISTINGTDIVWQYRTHYPNGYYDERPPVCRPEKANVITVVNAGGLADNKYEIGEIIADLEI